jgi:hypothetical protein
MPRSASSRRARRRVTSTPATASAHTGYCTSQATRKASGVNPPSAVRIAPIAASDSRVARNPPRLTMLWATARLACGLVVRAMSMPTTEPGPPVASTRTSTTSSQNGAGPGVASTAVQVIAWAAVTSSSSQERRSGWRIVSTPITGPTAIVAATNSASSAPAVDAGRPCAVTR